MTSPAVGAALGAFVGWLLNRLVTIAVRRSRLTSYLTVCLSSHFKEAKDNQKWLKRVTSEMFKEGSRICGAPFYTRDELDDISSVRNQSMELLSKREMTRLTKCYRSLWEIEVLFEGFCTVLRDYQASGNALDFEMVDLQSKRAHRLNALIDLLPAHVRSLSELPDDYAGIVLAELVVPSIR